MEKVIKRRTVTLNEKAKTEISSMLKTLKDGDKSVIVDYSKLTSFIISDYFEKYFNKNTDNIRNFFQDSKKKIIKEIEDLSPKNLEILHKYLSKLQ